MLLEDNKNKWVIKDKIGNELYNLKQLSNPNIVFFLSSSLDVAVTFLSCGYTSMMIYLRCTFAIQTIIFTETIYDCKIIHLHDETLTLKR